MPMHESKYAKVFQKTFFFSLPSGDFRCHRVHDAAEKMATTCQDEKGENWLKNKDFLQKIEEFQAPTEQKWP
ncbi:hypothetical protein [Herbaspirillum sp. NPDC087042]|uniref:hypothetical protein n=1 Tax=Herbaspirillum sp. NPDC087042 TaxID=3364004 RepID=UPI0037FF7B3A